MMGSLAREDVYAPDDPWMIGVARARALENAPPPTAGPAPNMGGVLGIGSAGNQIAESAGSAQRNMDYYMGMPSRTLQGVAPTVPGQWSEEDEFRRQNLAAEQYRWGPQTGFGMVFDPFAVVGVKPGVPGTTLGSGAMRPARQPEVSGAAGGSQFRTLASPEEITRAATESRKGITQPALRDLYDELGLTGREPLDIAKPSLAATQPTAARDTAINLKLADRDFMNSLTESQRKAYITKGKLPEGKMLPSQEEALPALEAFAPLKKEVTRAEKAFDKGVAAGNKPTIFDLSPQTLMQTPNVAQFPLPRVAPEMTERLRPASRGGLGRLETAAANAPLENWGWYNLMQQRDLAHAIHGPQKGEQVFNAWLDSVAGTSMVNPIDNNIRSSTWYLGKILRGEPLPEVIHLQDPISGKTVQTMAGGPPPGYGAKSQIQHAERVKDYLTFGFDPVANPKPISYRMNLGGNWMPRTVDTHDVRNMVGMPRALKTFNAENSALLPKEYSYLEDIGARAAQRAGTAQAPQQAATWVGGGEYTKLKSYPAPLPEALNRRVQVTAAVRGISPEQALHEAFTGVRGRELLGIGGAGAGIMGTLARQDNYE